MKKLLFYIRPSEIVLLVDLALGAFILYIGGHIVAEGQGTGKYILAVPLFLLGGVFVYSVIASPFELIAKFRKLKESGELEIIVSDFESSENYGCYRVGKKYLYIKHEDFCEYSNIIRLKEKIGKKNGIETSHSLYLERRGGSEIRITTLPHGKFGHEVADEIKKNIYQRDR